MPKRIPVKEEKCCNCQAKIWTYKDANNHSIIWSETWETGEDAIEIKLDVIKMGGKEYHETAFYCSKICLGKKPADVARTEKLGEIWDWYTGK
jgi:hypothetical protein